MPRKVFASEEERKEAQKEYQKKYRETHKEQCREYQKRYRDTNAEGRRKRLMRERIRRGATSYNEELTEEDRVEEISSAVDFIQQKMDNVQPSERYQEFVSLLAEHGIEDMDVVAKIYKAASVARNYDNSRRGFWFEKVIRQLLLNQLKDTSLYLYQQVPINDRKCRIDFVISEEKVMKDDLDLSKAIIVSTKTGFSSDWREDMHLYSQCKAYFMVTLNGGIPTEALPANVYFASASITEDTNHVISVNSLVPKIIELSGTS